MTHPLHLEDPALYAPGLRHAFFTREGGVSTGIYEGLNCGPGSSDDPEAVAENRAIALGELGGEHLVTCYQIHSPDVVTVKSPWMQKDAPKADAMVTDVPGIALGVLTADCAPILFADARARVIGAAHAGWGGATGGVIEATIEAMIALGAERDRIAAGIGPCISQANYEVGQDRVAAILAADGEAKRFFTPSIQRGKSMFDLPGYILARLGKAGITRRHWVAEDTYASPAQFYSFRRTTHRSETDYGRQLSGIVLVP